MVKRCRHCRSRLFEGMDRTYRRSGFWRAFAYRGENPLPLLVDLMGLSKGNYMQWCRKGWLA